jgi:hypothetical protein
MLGPIVEVTDSMTINVWLENALQDAERRGLPELRPLLEALARATSVLRTADWNVDAAGPSTGPGAGPSTDLRAGEAGEPRGPDAR